jgi:DNA-binding CsgD family transcriptional regulator
MANSEPTDPTAPVAPQPLAPPTVFQPTVFQPTVFEVSSEAGTARHPARSAQVRVGRALDNDVVLDGELTVSRQHAEFAHDGDGWTVRDVGSQNGTFVNGERIATVTPIGSADVVGVGAVTVRLVTGDGDPDGGSTVVDHRSVDHHKLLTSLSQREREVLALVAVGRTDDQIARELFISVKTVHSHLDRIRDKSNLRRRAELTRLAVRLGLSTGPTA